MIKRNFSKPEWKLTSSMWIKVWKSKKKKNATNINGESLCAFSLMLVTGKDIHSHHFHIALNFQASAINKGAVMKCTLFGKKEVKLYSAAECWQGWQTILLNLNKNLEPIIKWRHNIQRQ